MKSGGTFILGGLLQGLGKGITNMREERRQDALLKLKREYELADQTTAAAAAEAAATRAQKDRIEILDRGNTADIEKAKVTSNLKQAERAVDYTYDVKLENVRAGLDIKKDAASKRLAAEIDAGQVQGVDTAEDGSMIVTYKGGSVVKKNIKLYVRPVGEGDSDTPTIDGARGERGGKPAVAAPVAATAPDEQAVAMARLGSVYSNATPDRYPGLFRNGRKIPMGEAKQMILQRYSR